jgi:hypothetical protein
MKTRTNLKAGFDAGTRDIPAGPIWSDDDAAQKCPAVCAAYGMEANGNWNTTVPGKMSVCSCSY